jgi:alkanesulfonate monooxygenase SsuD/methylene tetrahydromethanopterin reductase-like flavin-dependent oxidoreductase (luciferase family)
MRFGAHLPIAGFAGRLAGRQVLIEYAETAEALGFSTLCANDHLVFSVPWMDALVALGVAAGRTSRVRLMTTAALLAVRGAAPLGSALAALQHLSEGRLEAAVTPGSSQSDYEAVGEDFGSRWARFDAEVPRLRAFLQKALPDAPPPIWIASWGSEVGLQRVARLGDGWLASAYHGTPQHLAESLAYLGARLAALGKDLVEFPAALATTYLYLSEDPMACRSALELVVSPTAAPSDLRDRLLIGTPEECVDRVRQLDAAGIKEVFVWPIRDELLQLRLFAEQVIPRVNAVSR